MPRLAKPPTVSLCTPSVKKPGRKDSAYGASPISWESTRQRESISDSAAWSQFDEQLVGNFNHALSKAVLLSKLHHTQTTKAHFGVGNHAGKLFGQEAYVPGLCRRALR